MRNLKRSTLRGYTEAIQLFCSFLSGPAYGWAAECEKRFGTHPTQVAHEWNTAAHIQDSESDLSKCAFTLGELEDFFGHADDGMARIRAAGRKGWLPAFRDAVLFKTAHAFELRRSEVRMLDLTDFSRNPHTPGGTASGFATFATVRPRRAPHPNAAAC